MGEGEENSIQRKGERRGPGKKRKLKKESTKSKNIRTCAYSIWHMWDQDEDVFIPQQ